MTYVKKQASEEAILALSALAVDVEEGPRAWPGTWVVGTVAVVEGYVDHVLMTLIAGATAACDPFVKEVVAEFEEKIFQSWSSRYAWLQKGFGVRVESCGERQAFDRLVDLRNACVHGHGELTQKQRGKGLHSVLALERELRDSLGVEVVQGKLLFSPSFGVEAVRIGREFVEYLDQVLMVARPLEDI